MNTLSSKQKALLVIAPALVLTQITVFQLLVRHYGDTLGYLLGYIVYWLVWCIPVTLLFIGPPSSILWRFPADVSYKQWIATALVALPAIATCMAVFLPYAPLAGRNVILLALLFAIVNAPLEEMLWRGVFPSLFPHNLWLGFLYPTFWFGSWHLAPALVKDSGMDGGILAFVGGAVFMGLVWGWFSYRYKSILPSTLAHLLSNFFAFTGFIYVNWFA
ncbi:CPBP family intramembrane metalloprotease [Brevibacillus ruminantium]|uniref:CPBP family intramembrane metalloprotease n=1 Tax=Brevibacillus ruminantium TaxID=2950604 RepID=A0ABY4WN86_9BACL|nr:CPBP family intramembrane glutamic endopeptidase [Brevibacillus ruminantium]USG67598.1 CPBP family intramembrane metalloprotease [Brevibacillus ruminantium]